MFMDKGIITEEEQKLISRYPENVQEQLNFTDCKDRVPRYCM